MVLEDHSRRGLRYLLVDRGFQGYQQDPVVQSFPVPQIVLGPQHYLFDPSDRLDQGYPLYLGPRPILEVLEVRYHQVIQQDPKVQLVQQGLANRLVLVVQVVHQVLADHWVRQVRDHLLVQPRLRSLLVLLLRADQEDLVVQETPDCLPVLKVQRVLYFLWIQSDRGVLVDHLVLLDRLVLQLRWVPEVLSLR